MPVLDSSSDVLAGTPLPTDKPKKPDAPARPSPADVAKTNEIVKAKFPTQSSGGGGGSRGVAAAENWHGITPPPFTPLPPAPEPKVSSPAEVWGSMAMVAAAIGGAMTRTHATTALNAAAEVMKGFHQGDLEATKDALDRWKIANNNTLQALNYNMEIFKAILANHWNDIRAGVALDKDARDEARFKLYAAGQMLRDQVLTKQLEEGDFDGATKHLRGLENTYVQLLEKSGDAQAAGEFITQRMELETSPEYQSASQVEKYGMQLDLMKRYAPNMDHRGDGSAADQREAGAVYDRLYPKDITGKRPDGTPDYEAWYDDAWPNWGHKKLRAQQDKALEGAGDYATKPDGTRLKYNPAKGPRSDTKNWEPVAPPSGSGATPPPPPVNTGGKGADIWGD